jgi:hypothetical protein
LQKSNSTIVCTVQGEPDYVILYIPTEYHYGIPVESDREKQGAGVTNPVSGQVRDMFRPEYHFTGRSPGRLTSRVEEIFASSICTFSLVYTYPETYHNMAFASRLLPGKVVAVTGCSTGIGRAVAIGTSSLTGRLCLRMLMSIRMCPEWGQYGTASPWRLDLVRHSSSRGGVCSCWSEDGDCSWGYFK